MKIEKELKSKINYLFDIFDKNDIKEVQVSFYGSGDDGNMEIYHALGKSPDDKVVFVDNMNWDEPTIFGDSLYELICEVSDVILDKKGIDYANGQGNNGNITYTVEDKNISICYLITEDAHYDFCVK